MGLPEKVSAEEYLAALYQKQARLNQEIARVEGMAQARTAEERAALADEVTGVEAEPELIDAVKSERSVG